MNRQIGLSRQFLISLFVALVAAGLAPSDTFSTDARVISCVMLFCTLAICVTLKEIHARR